MKILALFCLACWAGHSFGLSYDELEIASHKLLDIQKVLGGLSRQVMLQQLFVEEKVRSDGDSGVKVVRGLEKGLDNYDSYTHIGDSMNAIHDHTQYKYALGMGEVTAVLNGVDFRTRHNDYMLYQPSTSSKTYLEVQPIDFPPVPPEVLSKGTVEEQIAEMREWFKAFQNQDSTVRDYTQYFKPVLCYMEGYWSADLKKTDGFYSPKNRLVGKSWADLQEKDQFMSYSGYQDRQGNVAFLPTTMMSVNETTAETEYAQWNYRILCKPVDRDISFDILQQVDDVAYRAKTGLTEDEVKYTRGARFKLFKGQGRSSYSDLDEIFFTVPGLDNLPGDLNQIVYGGEALYDVIGQDVKLKSGYYHRYFKYFRKGAMGLSVNARCFNDENCWVAQNTQPGVATMRYEACDGNNENCEILENKFSYAIPLEIVFLSPLLSWNPYNITIHDDIKITTSTGGTGTKSNPYNGAHEDRYFLTPAEFFSEGALDSKTHPSDTGLFSWILDSNGIGRYVAGSGTRIMVDIPDSVPIRLRWPISPVHGEGSSVWKELNAIKDISEPPAPFAPLN